VIHLTSEPTSLSTVRKPRPAPAGISAEPSLASPIQRGARFFYKNGSWLVMSAPAVILLFIFSYLPMYGIVIAFKNYKAARGIIGSEWIGLKNFEFLFTTGKGFDVVRNTVYLNLLFIFTGMVASILIAFLLYELYGTFFLKFYQSSLFFPSFLSWVIVSYFVFAFLNTETGLVNKFMERLGNTGEPTLWYAKAAAWPWILMFVNLWKGAGAGSVIYLAGMLSINPEYYESAAIDGANKWQQRWHITLPLLRPLIMIQLLLALRGIFSADFGLFYFVTRNSAQLYSSVDVIDTYVYRALTQLGNVGMAAAAGLFQAAVGFVLVISINWIVRRMDRDWALF
jgi:putative aldouronate transport system permease protein